MRKVLALAVVGYGFVCMAAGAIAQGSDVNTSSDCPEALTLLRNRLDVLLAHPQASETPVLTRLDALGACPSDETDRLRDALRGHAVRRAAIATARTSLHHEIP